MSYCLWLIIAFFVGFTSCHCISCTVLRLLCAMVYLLVSPLGVFPTPTVLTHLHDPKINQNN